MRTYVSLLRGINVGPNKIVKMEDLVRIYESLGLKDVRTYLRSGNVIFDFPDTSAKNLEALIEEQMTRNLGFPIKVLLRTGDELEQIIASNPFSQGVVQDSSKLHVTFLSNRPSEESMVEVNAFKDEFDRFIIKGKEVYLFCPNGYGRTRFSNSFFEKELSVVSTTRNWKTVTALSTIAKKLPLPVTNSNRQSH